MVGDKIKAYRQSLGLNQAEFARKIGIRQGYLSEIERNLKVPGSKVVLSLLRFFPEMSGDFISSDDVSADKSAEKQPENGRRTDVKQVVEEGNAPYKAVYDGNRMMMEVIGSRMTPEGSCIVEGDHIIIDKSVEPQEGDYVLAKVGDAPGIIVWTPDAPQKPLGVIIKLTRDYR